MYIADVHYSHFYKVVQGQLSDLHSLLTASPGTVPVLREALQALLPALQSAWVYCSVAKQTDTAQSDVAGWQGLAAQPGAGLSKLKYIQIYTGLAMPNPALNQSARQKSVANMLATLRIEKLSPSESLKPSLQAYVDGQKTTTDLLNEVKAKYGALRRG
jgi:hypothetical protein